MNTFVSLLLCALGSVTATFSHFLWKYFNACLLIMILIKIFIMFSLTTDPVTQVGDTMLGLAVHDGEHRFIKHLIFEYNLSIDGECIIKAPIMVYLHPKF